MRKGIVNTFWKRNLIPNTGAYLRLLEHIREEGVEDFSPPGNEVLIGDAKVLGISVQELHEFARDMMLRLVNEMFPPPLAEEPPEEAPPEEIPSSGDCSNCVLPLAGCPGCDGT